VATTELRAIAVGLGFVLVFFFGFWLSRSGKPYGSLLLNAHKLIGLAVLVYLSVIFYQVNRTMPLGTTEWVVALVGALFFVVTIVSGGLVSIDRAMPTAVSVVHKVFPYLTVLSSAAILYLVPSLR
jgi:hypothetical protein